MVINFAMNDQFYIFRGQDGIDFLRGLCIARSMRLCLILPDGRRVNATLYATAADTLCLSLACDDLGDALAQAVFDETLLRLPVLLGSPNGRH